MAENRRTEFSSIGNLAFYNGWSPNYVYFNSLLRASMSYDANNSWNTKAASEVASKAVDDAKSHLNMFNNYDIGFPNADSFCNCTIVY